MKQYKELVYAALSGSVEQDRTGVGTIGIFGHQMRFDLRNGFPLVSIKRTNFKPIFEELMWFLRGETNIATLNAKIWDEWAYEKYVKRCSVNDSSVNQWMRNNGDGTLGMYTQEEFKNHINTDAEFAAEFGDLGPVYGKQWRSWLAVTPTYKKDCYELKTIDQIAKAIETLKKSPRSRRIIVSAWNPADVDNMALPPCHSLFQFYAQTIPPAERLYYALQKMKLDINEDELDAFNVPKYYLSLQLYQRSADIGLGVPFNIASYALLTELMAAETNMVAKDFIHTLGDAHVYLNHVEKMTEVVNNDSYPLPKLKIINKRERLEDYKFEDVQLIGYKSHPFVKLPVAV